MRALFGFSILLLVLLASSCTSMSESVALAEAEVPRFHQALDARQFEEVYSSAGDQLKKVAKKDEFVTLLDAVHRKLGNVKETKKMSWKVGSFPTGTFVTLSYETVFAEGKATEQFVYRIADNAASLDGYHINSNALIAK